MSEVSNSIFGEYDIRGIYGKKLDEDFAYFLGYSLKYFAQTPEICLARDGRLSSPSLARYLSQGLEDAGFTVYDIGLTASPILYYATKELKTGSGIMITASHNPPRYNGFKIILENEVFCGGKLKKLESKIEETKKSFAKPEEKNQSSTKIRAVDNFEEVYLKYLKSKFDFTMIVHLTVIWDPGNGASCNILKKLLKFLPGNHIIINETIDGNFPNRSPNPMIQANLSQLTKRIIEEKADFGIAIDGDGDRIAILNEKGQLVQSDLILLLFAEFLHQDQALLKVITDIKMSQLVLERLRSSKIENLMWKTGHSNIKFKMAEIEADLAGEVTGHFFFKDNYYFDDAIYAALKFCSLSSRLKTSISKHISENLPKIKASEELRLNCQSGRKFQMVERLKQILTIERKEFIDLDGIRYQDGQGWWLIRASNTEDCLSIRYEVYLGKNMKKFKADLNKLLLNINLKIE